MFAVLYMDWLLLSSHLFPDVDPSISTLERESRSTEEARPASNCNRTEHGSQPVPYGVCYIIEGGPSKSG